jgi:glycosyltransferase involved in cell wall biosynthesis
VIDNMLPDIGRDAGSHAILGHIRALIALGYRVEFVPAWQMAPPGRPGIVMRMPEVTWHLAPTANSAEEVLRLHAGAYDLIYLHRASNAVSYAALAGSLNPQARIVYSVADLHHVRLARQGAVQNRAELLAEASKVAEAELLAMHQVDAVITHSLAEAEYLSQAAPGVAVHVVPWAVKARAAGNGFAGRSDILFLGQQSHEPNQDAVRWLREAIMPRVWWRNPAITCLVVGWGWPEDIFDNTDDRLRLLGQVDHLEDVFARVRLTVAPLRFGAGVKGKVLESFAAGVPCIMSPIAAEGLRLPLSLRALVGATATEIAALIVKLYDDSAALRAAAKAGRKMIEKDFNLERVVAALECAVLPRPEPAAQP